MTDMCHFIVYLVRDREYSNNEHWYQGEDDMLACSSKNKCQEKANDVER